MDLAEILFGLRAALQEMDGVLHGLSREMESWMLVLACLFCGAWMVQFLERLTRILFFSCPRLLRWLWFFGRSGWCVFPGCKTRTQARYQLCCNHFLAASRCEWERQGSWGTDDTKSNAFYVYLLELDGGRDLYAGQTRNLIRHLYEHLGGKTKTTAGRRPVLAWVEQAPTRQAAIEKEADLKHQLDTNPERVRRMIAAFRRHG